MPWFRGEDQTYIPPLMSNTQMQALELLIAYSPDATDFAKKVIIWVLRQTEGLTRRVAFSVRDEYCSADLAAEVQQGAHDMISRNGNTHLNNVFGDMGTEVTLGHHCGCFESGRLDTDPFNTKANGRTIWFSYIFYDRDVTILEAPPLEELMKMELPS